MRIEKSLNVLLLCNPSNDGKAWEHFVEVYVEFEGDPRNVRLDLCDYDVQVISKYLFFHVASCFLYHF